MATKEYNKTIEDVKNLIQKLKDLQAEVLDIKGECLCVGLDTFTPTLQDIIFNLGDDYRLLESCLKHEGEI